MIVKKNRHHYHTPSQQRTSVRDARIVTYTNVFAQTQASLIGDSFRVQNRSRSYREFSLDNLIQTNFIVSKRAIRSLQMTSPEMCLSCPHRIQAQQIAQRLIDSHHLLPNLLFRIIENLQDSYDLFVNQCVRNRSHDSGNLA